MSFMLSKQEVGQWRPILPKQKGQASKDSSLDNSTIFVTGIWKIVENAFYFFFFSSPSMAC
jgi:hypothetical protein